MAEFVEELRAEAERAIAAMRSAAETARAAHARAELLRHMIGTAAKNRERPREAAEEAAVAESGWRRGISTAPPGHRSNAG